MLLLFGMMLCGTTVGLPLAAQMLPPKSVAVSGDKLFGQQCGACHSAKTGETRVGPSLAGVFGRKAGSVAGYAYSPALRTSKLTWTAATLNAWLTNSQANVPGSRMSYAQADPAKRRLIIDHLLSLK